MSREREPSIHFVMEGLHKANAMTGEEQFTKNRFCLSSYHSAVMIMFCLVLDLQTAQTGSTCQKSFYCFTGVLELLGLHHFSFSRKNVPDRAQSSTLPIPHSYI